MKNHLSFFIGAFISLMSCTGGGGESTRQEAQSYQQETALTDLQKMVKDVCTCMEEGSENQNKIQIFGCMMAIRTKYPDLDEMDQEEARAEINRQCPKLVSQFKKENGLQ